MCFARAEDGPITIDDAWNRWLLCTINIPDSLKICRVKNHAQQRGAQSCASVATLCVSWEFYLFYFTFPLSTGHEFWLLVVIIQNKQLRDIKKVNATHFCGSISFSSLILYHYKFIYNSTKLLCFRNVMKLSQ